MAVGGHRKYFDTFGTYGHELPGEAEETADMINNVYKKLLNIDKVNKQKGLMI